jgi:antitoxin HicB
MDYVISAVIGSVVTLVALLVVSLCVTAKQADRQEDQERVVLRSASSGRLERLADRSVHVIDPATNLAYLCHFRPESEGGFSVTCPKLPPVSTFGETLEEAQANAREAIERCLEVMRQHGEPIPPPDRDLASPIDQLAPVAAAGS